MSGQTQDVLTQFSEALAARVAAAAPLVAGLRTERSRPLSATLWRADVAIASAQALPRGETAELRLNDGRVLPARVAGRDPATNIVALRLEAGAAAALPQPAEPQLGGLALVLAADRTGRPNARLTLIRSFGPAWHSQLGGLIDRQIGLDLSLSGGEEGGPVFDAAGGLLGMSTAGPRGRGLVIPAATIERVLPALLAAGRVERGWLGVALQPVALPEAIAAATGQDRGLMVLRVEAEAPAAKAGVLAGDILVTVGEVAARHPGEIAARLGPESVGQSLPLRLVRAGGLLSLAAVVTARPAR